MSPRHYRDKDDVLRHRGTGRKVRSDYGTTKPHPHDCAHCAMVTAYRFAVEVEREEAGGWRNEEFRASFTFGDWLSLYYGERRRLAAFEAAEAVAWAA